MAPSPVAPNQPAVAIPGGSTAALRYVPEFDTFRAAAIASVFCHHWLSDQCWVNRVQSQTANGVHLFFVLSGFLITRILLQERAAVDQGRGTVPWAFRQFYVRRVLRIFPVYYLVLIAGTALDFPGLRSAFGWHAAYLSNAYYALRHLNFDGPASAFWTLAVEEQFYLVWPLAILLTPRRMLVPLVAAVAAVGTAVRGVAVCKFPPVTVLTPACANFLAMGALIAVVDHPTLGSRSAARAVRVTFAIVSASLLTVEAALVARHGVRYAGTALTVRAINQVVLSMAFAWLFARTSCGLPTWASRPLRLPPLIYLGRISYGLYVFHLFVMAGLARWVHAGWGQNFWVLTGTTVAVASASWFGVEQPINDLKRLFPYARPGERAAHGGHSRNKRGTAWSGTSPLAPGVPSVRGSSPDT